MTRRALWQEYGVPARLSLKESLLAIELHVAEAKRKSLGR